VGVVDIPRRLAVAEWAAHVASGKPDEVGGASSIAAFALHRVEFFGYWEAFTIVFGGNFYHFSVFLMHEFKKYSPYCKIFAKKLLISNI
jgi:hypothetical protein